MWVSASPLPPAWSVPVPTPAARRAIVPSWPKRRTKPGTWKRGARFAGFSPTARRLRRSASRKKSVRSHRLVPGLAGLHRALQLGPRRRRRPRRTSSRRDGDGNRQSSRARRRRTTRQPSPDGPQTRDTRIFSTVPSFNPSVCHAVFVVGTGSKHPNAGTSWRCVAGRFMIETRHAGQRWIVIVEPDPDQHVLVVVTAYGLNRD